MFYILYICIDSQVIGDKDALDLSSTGWPLCLDTTCLDARLGCRGGRERGALLPDRGACSARARSTDSARTCTLTTVGWQRPAHLSRTRVGDGTERQEASFSSFSLFTGGGGLVSLSSELLFSVAMASFTEW